MTLALVALSSICMQQTKAGTLNVSITPGGPLNLDVGQHVTLTAISTGGTGPYTGYQWYVNGVVISGAIGSTYDYTSSSAISVSITVTVTDSSPATSDPSPAISVATAYAPTVSIAPFGPLTLDVGQSQLVTGAPSGGSGPISYQWYLGATPVGSDSNTYSFSEAAGSYLVTCIVTDSADIPVTSVASNPVSVTVNPALVTPTGGASVASINRGQGSTISVVGLSGGTSPYSYQWLSEAPGAGSYSPIGGATSSTFGFSATGATAFGTWHFELKITDSADTQVTVTSSAATVEVCPIISFATNAAMTGDASGTVLTIDTVPHAYSDLQTLQFTAWTVGSAHAVTATTAVGVIGGVKQYVFNDWANGNGLVSSAGTFTTPSADTTVTMNYVTQVKNIFTVAGISGSDTVVLTGTHMGIGSSTIVTLNAGNSWSASAWSDYNTAVTFSATSTGSNSNERWAINGPFTIVAITTGGNSYSQAYTHQYQIAVAAPSNGQIFPSATAFYDAGSSQVFSFTAFSGYYLSDVIIDGVSKGASDSCQFNSISTYHTISAAFALDLPPAPTLFTVTASAGPGGSISPNGQITVNLGDTKTFTVSANANYHIIQVLIDSLQTTLNQQGTYTIANIASNHTISVSFAIDTFTISVSSVHGSPTASAQVNYGSSFKASVTSPETVTNTDQWICTGFSIDSSALQTGTSYTFVNVTADHIISFDWTENIISTITATNSNGTITTIPLQGNVTASQISNAIISSTPTSLKISLTITGPTGNTGICNMTIPKNTLPAGYVPTPIVYIDGQPATNQGSAQDGNSFYVWYILHFSTHQVELQFPIQPSPSPSSSPSPSPTPQPTPSPSQFPSAGPSPTATPTPTLPPTPQPTAPLTTTHQQTPALTPTPALTSAPTAKPTQTPTQTPTTPVTETPRVTPTTTASASTPTQKPSSASTAASTTTPPKQVDTSTAGLLTGEMTAMLAFIVAILVVAVLVFKKSKR